MTTDEASPARPVDPAIDAAVLLRLFDGAEAFLAVRAGRLNQLNVFPVPDGDTGTNMLLTLRAACGAARQAVSAEPEALIKALAQGALLGARGNSGVILSQYLRGFAAGLDGFSSIDGRALAEAFTGAAREARAAIAEPAEGTILTVASDVARAARESANAGKGPAGVLSHAVLVANQTVDRTRDMLPALRQVNVVDSGALGLATILDGLSRTLQGEAIPTSDDAAAVPPVAARLDLANYGFCTEFLVRGMDLDLAAIREGLAELGDSLIVVGESTLVRVHLHTYDPDQAIELAGRHGSVDQIKIENMQEQNRRLRDCGTSGDSELIPSALIVVAMGSGFQRLFRSLGASGLLDGESNPPPSVDDVLRSARQIPSDGYILLPNDPAFIAIAEAATGRDSPPIVVIPTRDAAQGVIAALAFQADRPLEENRRAMVRALASARTGRIFRAAEATLPPNLAGPGQFVGMVDSWETVANSDLPLVLLDVLAQLKGEESELVTLYVGALAHPADSAILRARIEEAYPHLQVEIVDGGQPHDLYILACE